MSEVQAVIAPPIAERAWVRRAHRAVVISAWVLLALQMAMPWVIPNFIAMDGPSHLYGAAVLRDLVLHHRTSLYAPFYTVQRNIVPNWTSTVLLAATTSLVGAAHAEQLFISASILVAFLSLSFAVRALAPGQSPWTPVSNFLLQSWFLFIGFYNFYLGMLLVPFAIGFYAKRFERFRLSAAVFLGIFLTLLFFTHLIAAATAILSIAAIALWCQLIWSRRERSSRLQTLGWTALATTPALTLIVLFLRQPSITNRVPYNPEILAWLLTFPAHVFQASGTVLGQQILIWPLVLSWTITSAVAFTKQEWRSPKGAVILSAGVLMLAYLLVPDKGFGGSEAKIRFSWAVFLIGGIAASASRLRPLRTPVGGYVALLLFAHLVDQFQTGQRINVLVEPYLTATAVIPPQSTIVRLHYPTPGVPFRFGLEGLARDPLFHMDALIASERNMLDLTDYEALSLAFPLVYKKTIDRGQQYMLWAFEGPDYQAPAMLDNLRKYFPRRIDYVIVIGEDASREALEAGLPQMLAYLDTTMRQVSGTRDNLVRVYRNTSSR